MDKALESKAQAEAKAANLGTVNTNGGFGAGAGGGMGLNKPGFGPAVQHFAGKSEPGKKTVDIKPEIRETWLKILDNNEPVAWVVCEYDPEVKSPTLLLKASGEGGMKEFIAALPKDVVAWGAFRCYGVDRRGGVDSKRAKFIFVQWTPEGISQMKKAKTGPHKGEVKEVLTGTHIDVMIENEEGFAPADLIQKLQAATGAHKPNGYEFEDGEFIEADYYGLGIGKDCKGETNSAN
mmetsp:Transcript_44597/g.105744  ORF Transcript_44597/g.105744 Transcript_44597/m.105744 type:complete len:236 (-) Transcript_44597:135-842(-)